ncbi:hypothetical protein VTJ04DRAFT_1907 [Mycothermus thermophilus]|uniref:uncharacterized protein n=1 Tax=Humicola insolens TaxID=85995 RepID=UPI003742CD64
MKAILAVTLLTSLAHAANSIIRPIEYEECNKCVDEIVTTTCGGNTESLDFAACFCKFGGDGHSELLTCLNNCVDLATTSLNYSSSIYNDYDTYCVRWYPTYCYNLSGEKKKDTYEQYCKDFDPKSYPGFKTWEELLGRKPSWWPSSASSSGEPNAAALVAIPAWLTAVGLGLAAVNFW